MDFIGVLKARRSTRKYQKRPVPDPVLRKILTEMQDSPSAGNLQSYSIVAVRSAAAKRALYGISNRQQFVLSAPVVLAFFADSARCSLKYGFRGAHFLCIQDATIAAAYFQLAAADAGLATCWVGKFAPEKVMELLRAPNFMYPVALITLGYSAEKGVRFPRRKLSSIFRNERF
ncbi:MAG: nitroreductase family protein [Candidatus Micrarchaeota archaeon]